MDEIGLILMDLVGEISNIRAGKTFTPSDYVIPAAKQLSDLIKQSQLELIDKIEGSLPTEWKTRKDRQEPTNRQLGYNDCLEECRKAIRNAL